MGMWKLFTFLVNWASLCGVRLLKPIFFPTAQKYMSGAYPYSMEVFRGSSVDTAFTEAVSGDLGIRVSSHGFHANPQRRPSAAEPARFSVVDGLHELSRTMTLLAGQPFWASSWRIEAVCAADC